MAKPDRDEEKVLLVQSLALLSEAALRSVAAIRLSKLQLAAAGRRPRRRGAHSAASLNSCGAAASTSASTLPSNFAKFS